jgi:hypothetical protein
MENFGLFYGHLVYNVAIGKFSCNLVYFETQNLNLEKFCSCKMENFGLYYVWLFEIYITAIWYILWPFGN